MILPELQPKALWFPFIQHWIKQKRGRGKQIQLVIDRTQWQDHNLIVVSLVHGKRAIPIYWRLLNKSGASNLTEQKAVIASVLRLLRRYRIVLLGDREFHSVALAEWCLKQRISFVLRLTKSTTVKIIDEQDFEALDAMPKIPGMTQFHIQVQVTQKKGFSKHHLARRWKRAYRAEQANEVWYLLTNLDSAQLALKLYEKRFSIEGMFKDFKSGGYNMENCQVNDQRFIALVGLIAIAYTISTDRGQKIRAKQVQHYVARPTVKNCRTQQHSQFWIGLYGSLWIESFDHWSDWAHQLMRLKPQKRPFYQRGLRVIQLIQSAL